MGAPDELRTFRYIRPPFISVKSTQNKILHFRLSHLLGYTHAIEKRSGTVNSVYSSIIIADLYRIVMITNALSLVMSSVVVFFFSNKVADVNTATHYGILLALFYEIEIGRCV